MLGKLREIVAFSNQSTLAKPRHDGAGQLKLFGCISDGVSFFFCHDHALKCSVSLQFDKNKAERVTHQNCRDLRPCSLDSVRLYVRATGVEPARVLPHMNLNHARLPISPRSDFPTFHRHSH
jgi:hypothetical protein